MKALSYVLASLSVFAIAVSPSAARLIDAAEQTVTSPEISTRLSTKNAYQERIWPLIKSYVPNAGDRKGLLCVFSRHINLTPYNILLQELYRESFGDGVADVVGDFLADNSHDYTYQFHLKALDNGHVRIHTFDTRDGLINHNYMVDFSQNETYNFVDYGKLPQNAQSREEILQIYIRFLPSVLQRRCTLQGFQFLES